MSRAGLVIAAIAVLACGAPPQAATESHGQPVAIVDPHEARASDALLGRPAPSITLELLDGSRVALGALAGKPVYLKFWTTWCEPCRRQLPHLNEAHRRYGDQLAVVAVNLGASDTVEAVREYQAMHVLTMPIAIDDGRIQQRYRVEIPPQHVVIDRAGIVRHVGRRANAELDRVLESVVAEASSTQRR